MTGSAFQRSPFSRLQIPNSAALPPTPIPHLPDPSTDLGDRHVSRDLRDTKWGDCDSSRAPESGSGIRNT
eukprot:7219873-Pyramimonas_sp.AAC.1